MDAMNAMSTDSVYQATVPKNIVSKMKMKYALRNGTSMLIFQTTVSIGLMDADITKSKMVK